MTLGAAAQVRLIVWRKACQHQVEPTTPIWLPDMARTSRFSIGASGWYVRGAVAARVNFVVTGTVRRAG